MVLGIRSKSRKSVSTQVNYSIHVQEIKPWPPSQSLRSVKSVLLQWENGDQNSGSLTSSAGDGKIEFSEHFNLSVLLWREASKKGKHRENFQKNCLEFSLYDTNGKSQLLGSATVNLADFGTIKETKAISIPLNCKKSFRSSTQAFLNVDIQPFDIECSSSSPNSNLSKELSLDKEESESASQSLKGDDIEIASFTDDEDDDIPSNALQTIRSTAEITGDSTKIGEGETKGSNGEFVLPSERSTLSSPGSTKVEASIGVNGIKSAPLSTVLCSNRGNATNDRSSLPKISVESVKDDFASSKIREPTKQSYGQIITNGGTPRALSPASFIPSSMKPNFERSSQSQKIPENSMTQKDSSEDQIYKKNGAEKVSSVSNTGVMEEKEKKDVRRKGRERFTMKNEISENELPVSNFSDDDSTMREKLNSAALLRRKKSHVHPKIVLANDKVEDVINKFSLQSTESSGKLNRRNEISENELPVSNFSDDDSTMREKLNSAALLRRKKSHVHPKIVLANDKVEDVINKFSLQSTESSGKLNRTQTLEQEPKDVNDLNNIHVGTASHGDNYVTGSFINDNAGLKAEVEMLREELREAAALEASMYSVIAEHGSSSNKVHAPARRLSRFYFHSCRVGSPATIASATQSAVSGFVLVSKACGNDVPRLTFWFSNLILLRAIVSKGIEDKHLSDGPRRINSEEDENAENNFHSWQDPKTFLVALEKVETWIFSRIVESVWWQTLTPYMQSAAAKNASSRKINGKRYHIGDQDQGSFSIDLWKRAFKDACDRLCPLRAGGHECGCLPVIARSVMEQLVNRLDVAMFNAILRESAEEMPTDPISDPISDSKVLPIPAGKSGFGAGAQLKNAIGDWSRWLSDLFGIDDSDSHEDSNENDDPKYESTFKPFPLLNSLSDLMMLPSEMLADGPMRKEVCPRFGVSLIKRVVDNFIPDEFSPAPIPDAVLEALNNEDIQDDEGSITSFPCSAGATFYEPPPARSVMGMLKEVGTQTSLRSGSFVLKKLYTSDDELDELDSPLSALGMDDSSLGSTKKFAVGKGGRKVVRYELLREVWKSSSQ